MLMIYFCAGALAINRLVAALPFQYKVRCPRPQHQGYSDRSQWLLFLMGSNGVVRSTGMQVSFFVLGYLARSCGRTYVGAPAGGEEGCIKCCANSITIMLVLIEVA